MKKEQQETTAKLRVSHGSPSSLSPLSEDEAAPLINTHYLDKKTPGI